MTERTGVKTLVNKVLDNLLVDDSPKVVRMCVCVRWWLFIKRAFMYTIQFSTTSSDFFCVLCVVSQQGRMDGQGPRLNGHQEARLFQPVFQPSIFRLQGLVGGAQLVTPFPQDGRFPSFLVVTPLAVHETATAFKGWS